MFLDPTETLLSPEDGVTLREMEVAPPTGGWPAENGRMPIPYPPSVLPPVLRDWKGTDLKELMHRKWRALRKTCFSRHIPCEITEEDLWTLWRAQEGYCYYTGVQLEPNLQGNPTKGLMIWKERPRQWALDRLEPAKGFVMNNVVWCSSLVQWCKRDLPVEGFLQLAEMVVAGKRLR